MSLGNQRTQDHGTGIDYFQAGDAASSQPRSNQVVFSNCHVASSQLNEMDAYDVGELLGSSATWFPGPVKIKSLGG